MQKVIAKTSNQEKRKKTWVERLQKSLSIHIGGGAKFLAYCVEQGWLKQEGSGGRGTKWYPTGKGKEELKEKFGIEL